MIYNANKIDANMINNNDNNINDNDNKIDDHNKIANDDDNKIDNDKIDAKVIDALDPTMTMCDPTKSLWGGVGG